MSAPNKSPKKLKISVVEGEGSDTNPHSHILPSSTLPTSTPATPLKKKKKVPSKKPVHKTVSSSVAKTSTLDNLYEIFKPIGYEEPTPTSPPKPPTPKVLDTSPRLFFV